MIIIEPAIPSIPQRRAAVGQAHTVEGLQLDDETGDLVQTWPWEDPSMDSLRLDALGVSSPMLRIK